MTRTEFDPGYLSTMSTYGCIALQSRTAKSCDSIVDIRPWYRRWWFGFCRDGELWLGLGPVAVAITRTCL
jgi:hypothetical protein